jgi:hypothetical protein
MSATNKANARASLVRRLLEHGALAFRRCVVELRQVVKEKDKEHFSRRLQKFIINPYYIK